MKRQHRSFVALVALALGATFVHAEQPKLNSDSKDRVVVEFKSPAPELEIKDPVVGRNRRAVLEERLKDKRDDLKETETKIAELAQRTASPEERKQKLDELEKKKKDINSVIERTKSQLSKEKRDFRKERSSEQKSMKRRWGKHFSSPAARAEAEKHSRRVAMLERIHYVALVERQFEVVGRAALALRAEEHRHQDAFSLITRGVKIPALPGAEEAKAAPAQDEKGNAKASPKGKGSKGGAPAPATKEETK